MVEASLQDEGLEKIELTMARTKMLDGLPIHDQLSVVGPNRTRGLPFFHTFTGCDAVSAFLWKGKK